MRTVGVGNQHTCALLEGGEMRCWGYNFFGQVGDGTQFGDRHFPVPVLRSPGVPLAGVEAVALGQGHSCAVTAGGAVYCWGSGYGGALGDGTAQGRVFATPVVTSPGVPLAGALAVALGDNHSCALLEGGQVHCWGLNSNDQLGDGSAGHFTPAPVLTAPGVPLTGVQAIASGPRHTCALVEGGQARCWGDNTSGALGYGQGVFPPYAVPVQLSPGVPLTGVKSLAAGDDHTCAVVEGGEARCWGRNALRQLGDGTTTTRYSPVPVDAAPGVRLTGVQVVSLGDRHSCALLDGGEARCWGWNNYGNLGDGTHVNRAYPTPVAPWPELP